MTIAIPNPKPRNTAMPFDGPAAGIGGHLLTRLDLTDEEVVKDAASELRRCADSAALASWSRKWGEAALERCAANITTTRRHSNTKWLRA